MPPPAIRRPISITVWLVLSLTALTLAPVLWVIAELLCALTGDRRAAMAVRLLLVYFLRELLTLCACGATWLLAGAGWKMNSRPIEALHWRLLRWFTAGLACSVLNTLQIEVEEAPASADAAQALLRDGPMIVLSRHAGPADTLMIIDRLLSHFARRPSVVFKEAITLDPSIDLITHRLPHAVLDIEDPPECEARIARTAARLGERGALLLFPEGGNFTRERRRKALASLRRHGHTEAARAGEEMQHVMAPRPAGTVAALRGNAEADIVFMAHTGLGLAAFPRELWRELPIGGTLRTRMWFVPRSEVPADDEDVAAWLTDWWLRLDRWIDGQGTES
jgi:1-acyl-sn-glycerol-3-phosphate acyltransferase